MKQYRCYDGSANVGTFDTLEEAEEFMTAIGFKECFQASCDGSILYWSLDGKIDTRDDGAYCPQITEVEI